MSLDIYLHIESSTGAIKEVFESNITHNLGQMARKAGIYEAMWRPEDIGAVYARDIIPLMEKGVADLATHPADYEPLEPANGWGTYEGLLDVAMGYLRACKEWPEAKIYVSR